MSFAFIFQIVKMDVGEEERYPLHSTSLDFEFVECCFFKLRSTQRGRNSKTTIKTHKLASKSLLRSYSHLGADSMGRSFDRNGTFA